MVGVDIEIKELSKFITNLKISKNSKVFMMDKSLNIIAFPNVNMIQFNNEEQTSKLKNLNEIDVSSVNATFTTVEGGAILREDIAVQNQAVSNHILNNAPKSKNGYFIVPKIIE